MKNRSPFCCPWFSVAGFFTCSTQKNERDYKKRIPLSKLSKRSICCLSKVMEKAKLAGDCCICLLFRFIGKSLISRHDFLPKTAEN